MEKLAKYVRENRPAIDPLEYDRHIRLLLNWLDTHKIREKAVFEAMEGKEYAAMLQFVEERTGITDFKVDTELFQLLLAVSSYAAPPSASGVASGASSAAGGGSRQKKRFHRM